MPFTDIAPPPAPPPPGTGFTFSLQVTKRITKARLIIRADKQDQFFGGSVAGKAFSAQVGRGSDEGKLRLVLDPQGDLEAKPTMKGSVIINMRAWDLLPKDKRPAAACEVLSAPSSHELILKLPSFCKPSGVDGKLAAEFALKKGGAK